MPDPSAILHSYGGPVLLLWAALQGEAAVIVAGSLATRGYWPWWVVWLVASMLAIAGHQLYFALGRRYGDALVARLPAGRQPAIARAKTLLQEHATRLMLVMRFAYGIRLPLPILCGAAGIAPLRFLRYNVATALAWALIFTALGVFYGAGATALFGRVAHYEAWILVASVLFGLVVQVATHALGKPRF